MRKLESKYGYFLNDEGEYIIKTPLTPRPWINVISNGLWGTTVSQAGGGYSWLTHAGLNRINRWEQDLIKDDWGKFIYIRDDDSKAFWSAGYKPVCRKPEEYRCAHGLGYTKINSKNDGIATSLAIFAPLKKVVNKREPVGEPLEVWRLTVENKSSRARRLSLFTYLEWCLGESPDWHREFHKVFIDTDYSETDGALYATKRLWTIPNKRGQHWNRDWDYTAFHSANVKPVGFTADKESFIGKLRSLANPQAVEEGTLNSKKGKWNDSIASLHIRLALKPNEKKEVIFTLGAAEDRKSAVAYMKKYNTPAKAEKALHDVAYFWMGYAESLKVKTPDEELNLMLNSWLKYQAISGRMWGRSAYYQTGGAFGFRDQLQDSQIFLPLAPALTKKQIILHARHQFQEGRVFHWWHPIIESGLKSNYSDDLLWLPFVVVNYLKETNDFAFLNEKIAYFDGGTGSLLEHCTRALDLAIKRKSRRGIPLILEGDWNDGLNCAGHGGKGESFWVGQFICYIVKEFAPVLKKVGKAQVAKQYEAVAKELKDRLNRYGWDGAWYVEATCDDGSPIGSKRSKEGKIHLNPQTWALISDTAVGDRSKLAMDSAEKLLNKRYGPLLLSPAYSIPDERVGYLTRYAPGVRENGGVYTHAATWCIWAECLEGKGDKAYETLRKILPSTRWKDPDLYKAEPYVTPGNVDGPDSENYGTGGWSWYTGSAAWLFRIATEWVLGVRPTYEGLVVDPCIPKGWKSFTIRRSFRGATYEIEVANKDGVSHGVKSISVDGKALKSNIIAPFKDKKVHKVKVIMGRA